MLLQEEADRGQVLVKASTLPVTPGPPHLLAGNCMSPLSRGRQEDLGGGAENNSLHMCLSSSISSIASKAMTGTLCNITAVSISKGALVEAPPGAGIQATAAEAIPERLCFVVNVMLTARSAESSTSPQHQPPLAGWTFC